MKNGRGRRTVIRYLITTGGFIIIVIGAWNCFSQEWNLWNILFIAGGILISVFPWLLFTKNDRPLG